MLARLLIPLLIQLHAVRSLGRLAFTRCCRWTSCSAIGYSAELVGVVRPMTTEWLVGWQERAQHEQYLVF